MTDPEGVPAMETDPQDTAEIYDETHLDDEGEGDALLDELDDVYDATRGDGALPHPSRLTPHENRAEDSRRALEAEADNLLGQSIETPDTDTDDSPVAESEIELVYTGLMRNQRGAQGSAAHWEARRLSDQDIDALGYGANDQNPTKEE